MGKKKIGEVSYPTGRGKSLPVAEPVSIDGLRFQWSAQDVDYVYAGEWDWNLDPKEARDILDLLAQMSQLTWREIKNLRTNSKSNTRALHHSQPLDSICAEAQSRLDELEIMVEEVFRLRHGNFPRLWGYMTGPIFNVVWWDRAHKVCPTEK